MLNSLRRDRRGVGSIIGATFVLLIIITGFIYYNLQFQATDEYNETLREMQELDQRRSNEALEILSVIFSLGELNITVKNMGSNMAHLIWLGIFDETVTPNTQDYYLIDFYISPDETVTNVGNDTIPSFEGEERIIQIVTELGNTFSQSYPDSEEEESEYDFVDAEGDPPAIGTHSLFSAQQLGPDGIADELTEGIYDQEEWMSLTGYEDPGNEWLNENNAFDEDTMTAAMDDIPGNDIWSSYLVLTRAAMSSSKMRYYIGREDNYIDQVEIDVYNGSWVNVYSGAGTWDVWANVSFTETTVTKMRFRFFNTNPSAVQRRIAYVYEADFLRSPTIRYRLDLEVQWTSADYDETDEWLSIYGGTMGPEALQVDVWNDTDWVTVLTDLETGWNSVNVSSYLTSSTFKIRFRDTLQTDDLTQDSWEIDATFLRVWTP
jgi:nicotinamide mononucleotide adenylyltransferase